MDEFGEEDPGMRRGRQLLLSTTRLNQLTGLWRGAAFDFDSNLLHGAQLMGPVDSWAEMLGQAADLI